MYENNDEKAPLSRREFLQGVRGWSAVVAGLAVGLAVVPEAAEAGWLNGFRGGWLNRAGGWGGGWLNNRFNGGGWVNGAGGWLNRASGVGWGGGYGGGWANRGGGSAWVNRPGGSGWINRRW